MNQIIGSICVYMLMGLAWAIIYLIQMELFAGSFNGLEDKVWTHNLFEALYFSFITLTTVGYGDISPALPVPKFFVFMESIIGSFYVAILVASLVSSRLSQSEKNRALKDSISSSRMSFSQVVEAFKRYPCDSLNHKT
ncbi:potassium channel protein [Vibrio astriarenae]|nr:potassium channel protein [Vibrio sp. C7]